MRHVSEKEYKIAKETIEMYEENQKVMEKIADDSCCSKCGNKLSDRWEQNACSIGMDINIHSQLDKHLFGPQPHHMNSGHPAIPVYRAQKALLLINKKAEGDHIGYQLCISCFDKFIRTIGEFIEIKGED